jgi:catechol 2,3-dioxygenase-like lactoylglutathione lyase family enzyme
MMAQAIRWRISAAGQEAGWEGGMGQQSGPLGADVAVTHILVVADPAASRDFWVNVLGAEMTLRVADCHAAYAALTARGAAFLTPPHDWGGEIRCFLRDPDGHLVEISESVPT